MEQWNVSLKCEVIEPTSSTDVLEENEQDRVISMIKVQSEFPLHDVETTVTSSEYKMSPSFMKSPSLSSLDRVVDNEENLVVTPLKNEITTEFLTCDDSDSEQLIAYVPTVGDIHNSDPTKSDISIVDSANSSTNIKSNLGCTVNAELNILDDNSYEMIKLKKQLRDRDMTNKAHQRQKFTCGQCSKIFKDTWHMQRHEVLHTKQKPLMIVVSPLNEITTESLRRDGTGSEHLIPYVPPVDHINNSSDTKSANFIVGSVNPTTNIQKKFARFDAELNTLGDDSDKIIKLKNNLTVRGKRIRQPFSCSQCSKTFKDKWHMQRHEVQHTKHRPFTVVVTPLKNEIKADTLPSIGTGGEQLISYVLPVDHINNNNHTELSDAQCSYMHTVEFQELEKVSSKSSDNITVINKTMMLDKNVQKNKLINIVRKSKKINKSKLKQQNYNPDIVLTDSTTKIQTTLSTKSAKSMFGSVNPLIKPFVSSVNPLINIQKKLARIDAELNSLSGNSDKMIKLKTNLKVRETKPRQEFACSHCSKKIKGKWHMHRHEVLHTKQRPFTCAACSKTFTRKDKLKIHKCRVGPNILASTLLDDNSLEVGLSGSAKRFKSSSTKILKNQPQSVASKKSFKNTKISKNDKPVHMLELLPSVSKKLKEDIINLDSSEDELGSKVENVYVVNDSDVVNNSDGDDDEDTEVDSLSEFQCRDTFKVVDGDIAPFVMDCENISDDTN